jgi:uncharacterized LabA/DUF88 family protein
MRIRRIAILIDGGFFVKRLSKLVTEEHSKGATAVAESAHMLCKRHVQKLTGERFSTRHSKWLDHVYRLFYYDATPYDGIAHNPLSNQQIKFNQTDNYKFRHELFSELRRRRKFALRLGKVNKEDGWHLKNTNLTKKLLQTTQFLSVLKSATGDESPSVLSSAQITQLQSIASAWEGLTADDLKLGLRQKGVDMRIGIDITTLTLKKQVDTIILVTGDSDFVPAAKVARREGVEFLLDPLWQKVNDDLHEHVDGIVSGFPRPGSPENPTDDDTPDLPTTSP